MSTIAALLVMLFPAFIASRSPISAVLKTGDRAARGGASGVRNVLVVAQIAFAFALVVSCM